MEHVVPLWSLTIRRTHARMPLGTDYSECRKSEGIQLSARFQCSQPIVFEHFRYISGTVYLYVEARDYVCAYVLLLTRAGWSCVNTSSRMWLV